MSENKSTPAPKVILTIGNPEKYISKAVDAEGKRKSRVAYQVTGSASAIALYNADMLARANKESKDEVTGNPLYTISLGSFQKGGLSGTIERSSKPDESGNFNWYIDNQESRDLDEAVANADEFTKQAHAMAKYEELKASIKAMAQNKRAKQTVVASVKEEKL